MTTQEKLKKKNSAGKFICVGLDTDIEKIPSRLLNSPDPVLTFNKSVIQSTKDEAAAFKLNLAFYESNGSKGLKSLEDTLNYFPDDVVVIADGKRGDIGNTSVQYSKSIFEHFNFDAATLNPFMGRDSLQPFLDYAEKLNFILTLTSNKGSNDFQNLLLQNGKFLYQKIIERIHEWNANSNCGIVFGATNLQEISLNIQLIGDLPLLIPGVGAQGGSAKDVLDTLKHKRDENILINVSRSIIYRSSEEDFAERALQELRKLNKEIGEVIS